MSTAVHQLDQMTQQNSALVEESTAAADSLREQALRLTEVVALFRVSGSTAHAAPRGTPAALAPRPVPAPHASRPPAPRAPAPQRPTAVPKAKAPALPPKAPAAAKPAADDMGDWESF